jgi:hypothetical protein
LLCWFGWVVYMTWCLGSGWGARELAFGTVFC